MITYELKKAVEEGGEDTIVKSGQSHEFKMSDVRTHMTQLAKQHSEMTAQIGLERAKVKNVTEHHPVILTLSDEQLTAASILNKAKPVIAALEAKLAEIEAQQELYTLELGEIEKQTGVKLELPAAPEAPAVTPVEEAKA